MVAPIQPAISILNEAGLSNLFASEVGPYWHFSGVFHPAIAHFPIALLVVAGFVELVALFRPGRRPGATTLWCLWLGSLSAVAAAVLGWANADAAQEFSGKMARMVWLHRWLGVGVAGGSLVVACMATVAARSRDGAPAVWLARIGTFGVAALVGLVGSFGGKLTHGVDYYAEAYKTLQDELHGQKRPVSPAVAVAQNPGSQTPMGTVPSVEKVADASADNSSAAPVGSTIAAAPAAAPNGDRLTYRQNIKPIFEANCLKCHNGVKQKGGYRLDSKIFAFNVGESGEKAIVPGNSAGSLIIKMIEGKGKYAEGRMPPKGTLLNAEQVATLRKWIDQGAEWSD